MRILIIITFTLWGMTSTAFWKNPSEAVVKVYSGVKGMPPRYVGSGILFHHNNEVYVLTSDHVIGRSTSFIHSIENYSPVFYHGGINYAQKAPAEYVMSDWGRRFALLKLKNTPWPAVLLEALPNFDELGYSGTSQNFDLSGFPANSFVCLIHTTDPALPLWNLTTQHVDFAAQISSLWNREQTFVEFGMSGGVVYIKDPTTQQHFLVGMISHQIYGAPTQPGPELGLQNEVLAIPFDQIQPVIKDILDTGKSNHWNFFEQPTSGGDFEVVDSGPLTFNIYKDSQTQTGNDVSVRYYPKRASSTQLYPDQNGTLAKIEAALQAREKSGKLKPTSVNLVKIIGRRLKGNYGTWTGISLKTLVEFVRLLDDARYEPVMYYSYENLDDIRNNVRTFRLKFNGCNAYLVDPEASELCERMNWISEALTLPPSSFNSFDFGWTVLKPSDLEELLSNQKYAKAWDHIPYSAGTKADIKNLKAYFEDLTL